MTLGRLSGSSIFHESMRSWIAFFRVLQVLVVWPGICRSGKIGFDQFVVVRDLVVVLALTAIRGSFAKVFRRLWTMGDLSFSTLWVVC